MALRSTRPLAGYGWLRRAIDFRQGTSRAAFGGAALVVVMSLLPSLVTLPMQLRTLQAGAQPDPGTIFAIMAVSMVAGLLLTPLFAGYLRLVAALERGQPGRATDVFAPYRQGETLRFAGYGVAMLLVYVAMIALVLVVAGGGLGTWYLQLLTTPAGATPASVPPLPALPSHFGAALALLGVFGLLLMGIYAISLGQVALRGRSVLGAIGDGVLGSLKNLLPLLVFVASFLLAWVVVLLGLLLAVGLVVVLGRLLGDWTLVLLLPPYLALMLGMFVVMFRVVYHLWHDVCGDDVAPAQALAA